MMKIAVVILSVASMVSIGFSGSASAQVNEQWAKEQLSNPDFDTEEFSGELRGLDLSDLWMSKQDFILGFIGEDYQRLRIRFLSIEKDAGNPLQYKVTGKSKVESNISDFSGTITLESARKYSPAALDMASVDFPQELRNAVKDRGVIVAKLLFDEDPRQKYPGRFEGRLVTTFWIDPGNEIFRDGLTPMTDDRNNEFVGTWTSVSKKLVKPVRWGEYRIPLAGDLDQGSSEFSPDDKYLKNGWEDVAREGYAWWNVHWWRQGSAD